MVSSAAPSAAARYGYRRPPRYGIGGERRSCGRAEAALSLLYADTSALLRAYFPDETDHALLRARLLEGTEPVVTSELARVEFASAVRAAGLDRRVRAWRDLLGRFDEDSAPDGPVALLELHPGTVLPAARRLVLEHRLRTLDAIHLAVAIEECPAYAGGLDIVFVTRDGDQAAAARALGLTLLP